jgi:AcrR family transcriptional regulator
VGRPSTSERLASLATAATESFGRLGYRGTRTADVAAKAGMSAGSLFNYVESKEALFQLVFRYGVGLLKKPPALPLATPGPGETVALVSKALRKTSLPRLGAALRGNEPADICQELHGIVEECYDLIDQHWPLFAVLERCAVELPELDAVWLAARAETYAALAAYLERRTASGQLRPMPDAMVAARMIIESAAWFAWHRREGRDSGLYNDQAARRTVIEFACAALLPDSARVSAAPPADRASGLRPTARRSSPLVDAPNSALKEQQSWTDLPATTRPATSGHLTPIATGPSPS